MSIADNIKHLRESRELTQIQFAELFGVSDKTVSTWEIGTRTPRMGVIQKIADYYHITKSDIIEGDLQNINSENLELSAREESLITNYRQLNTEGKDKTDDYVKDLLKTGNYSDDDNDVEIVTIAARKGGGKLSLKKRGNKSIFDAPDYR